MHNIINVITFISAVVLVAVILMQNQGSGLGAGFGGESNSYRSKRGIERVLFGATIVLAIIFVSSVIAGLVIPR